MSYILAFVQLVFIMYICIYEVRRKSSASFLWATLLIMFGTMHLLSVFAGDNAYSNLVLNQASLFVILFCLTYMIVRVMFSKKTKDMNSLFMYETIAASKPTDTYFLFIIITVVLILMSLTILRYSGGLLNTSWASGRAYLSSLDYVNSKQVYKILYFSLSGLPIYYWICNKRKRSIFLLCLILFLELVTRNRVYILPFFIFFICLVLFKIRKIKLKHCLLGIIGAILVIYIVYGIRVFRHYGTMQTFINSFDARDFTARIISYIETDNGELGLRNKFYYFLQNNNHFSGFGTGAGYIRILLVYIPTKFSLGLKPNDFAITMGSAVGMMEGGSTHPTLFGDCYANLGWVGVLLGGFWAFICSVCDYLIMKLKKYPYQICAFVMVSTCLVIVARGSAYNAFHLIAWGFPTLYIIRFCQEKLSKVKVAII